MPAKEYAPRIHRSSRQTASTPVSQELQQHADDRLLDWVGHLPTAKNISNLQRALGNRAAQNLIGKHAFPSNGQKISPRQSVSASRMPIQRTVYSTMKDMWNGVANGISQKKINKIIGGLPELTHAYADLTAHLSAMDFQYVKGKQPEADLALQNNLYPITYGHRNELDGVYSKESAFVGAILHEMMHITAALQYSTNVPSGSVGHGANMHLPAPQKNEKVVDSNFGLTETQFGKEDGIGATKQINTMFANYTALENLVKDDVNNNRLKKKRGDVLLGRIKYATLLPGLIAHYDTVLLDMLYYLQRNKVTNKSKAFARIREMLDEANTRRKAGKGTVKEF